MGQYSDFRTWLQVIRTTEDERTEHGADTRNAPTWPPTFFVHPADFQLPHLLSLIWGLSHSFQGSSCQGTDEINAHSRSSPSRHPSASDWWELPQPSVLSYELPEFSQLYQAPVSQHGSWFNNTPVYWILLWLISRVDTFAIFVFSMKSIFCLSSLFSNFSFKSHSGGR